MKLIRSMHEECLSLLNAYQNHEISLNELEEKYKVTEISLGTWIYFSHIKVFTVFKGFLSQIISRYEMDRDIERLIDEVQTKL
ncbi:hypothetical protein QZH41_008087 [Actinostola sp. cb2023]|nr:hypothetical protein QZH41_008087 [Actinostola sp. cb2023]